MTDPSHSIEVRRRAWDEDIEISLPVPPSWTLQEFRLGTRSGSMSLDVESTLSAPVGSAPVSLLARGKQHVGIIIDDLTRPTCAYEILPHLIAHLAQGGVTRDQITLFIATGSHGSISHADLARKAGTGVDHCAKIVVHDCHGVSTSLGRTPRGTPVLVNAELMACDLKIGIGAVFPHPAAAFSGGTKLLAPGMCGAATIRHLHDHVRTAEHRGGDLNCDIRQEMNVIARMAGLDQVVLAIPGADRKAIACVAGSPEAAMDRAVRLHREIAGVPVPDAVSIDAVIMDAYPFDSTLQFAHDRALWPLSHFPPHIPAVLIAACQRGAGTHEFFPAADPFAQRALRRLKEVRVSDVRRAGEILRHARSLYAERKREIIILAEGVRKDAVRRVFPHGIQCTTWTDVCRMIDQRVHRTPRRIAVYHTAPLLLPLRQANERK